MAHIAHRLQAFLSGGLSPAERDEVDAHLSACPQCREERDLLAVAAALISPLPPREPRAGFAAMVALNARDLQTPFHRWLRWSLGGVGAAVKRVLLIAVALLAAAPARAQQSAEDRFRSLPPEKQEELRQRFRELQSLPPEERAELRRNLDRLDSMPEGEREALEQNYRRFQEMSP